jgi:hypothetical protein
MTGGGKRAIEIAHRRWGKDEIVMSATCELMHQRTASYWHCLPEYSQARKALWTAVNAQTGVRRIDEMFPPEIRETTREQEMFIRLKCGSTWQIIGSDNYNSLVGAGVAGVVFSEWALANPSSWAYIRPMIEENNGFAAFITTPRGKNHAHAMYQRAKSSPNWFAEISTVHDTGALTQSQLDEALGEYQDIYGIDAGRAYFEQEYLCSFDAAILGAYYGGEMRRADIDGRITSVPWDERHPVYTIWDLGYSDDTVILFFQVLPGEVRIIGSYEANGHGVEHYADIVKGRPYRYAKHWLPHDAQARLMAAAGRSVLEQLRDCGLSNLAVLQNRQTEQQGILAVRQMFPRLWIDAGQETFIEAIRQFRREWDDDRKCFKEMPRRDWTNHFADALRYLAWVWKEPVQEQPKPPGRTIRIGGNSTLTMNDLWNMESGSSRRI